MPGPFPPSHAAGGGGELRSQALGGWLCPAGRNTARSTLGTKSVHRESQSFRYPLPPPPPVLPDTAVAGSGSQPGLRQTWSCTRTGTQSAWLSASLPLRSHGNWMINFSGTLME